MACGTWPCVWHAPGARSHAILSLAVSILLPARNTASRWRGPGGEAGSPGPAWPWSGRRWADAVRRGTWRTRRVNKHLSEASQVPRIWTLPGGPPRSQTGTVERKGRCRPQGPASLCPAPGPGPKKSQGRRVGGHTPGLKAPPGSREVCARGLGPAFLSPRLSSRLSFPLSRVPGAAIRNLERGFPSVEQPWGSVVVCPDIFSVPRTCKGAVQRFG